MILTADLHLTDNPLDEYRWSVFDRLAEECHRNRETHVVIAGDLTDRKDRHSAVLVNRMVMELTGLAKSMGHGARIDIIKGNHDEPLKGDPFWVFLGFVPGIYFHASPMPIREGRVLLLPFAANPAEHWAGLNLGGYDCIIMHQTVTGAVGEGGVLLTNENMPDLPQTAWIYSGDIHTPQEVGPLQYIGAPHPIKFGDDYPCRFLRLLDTTFEIDEVIPLDPMRKHMVDIGNVQSLSGIKVRAGDQAKVRFRVGIDYMDQWPVDRDIIKAWFKAQDVKLVSLEAIVESRRGSLDAPEREHLPTDPREVFDAYCRANKVGDALTTLGRRFLDEAINASLGG